MAAGKMETTIWLKIKGIKRNWGWAAGAISASKSKPQTNRDEIAMQIQLVIPNAVFEVPSYKTKIEFPEPDLTAPEVIDVEEALSNSLREQLGIKVDVQVEQVKIDEP